MDSPLPQSEQIGVAVLSAHFANLSKSMDEMKAENKEFHEKVFHKIEEFGTFIVQQKAIEEMTKKNSEFIEELGPVLKEMVVEKKDNRRRFKDILWSRIVPLVTLLLTVLWGLWLKDQKAVVLTDEDKQDIANKVSIIYAENN